MNKFETTSAFQTKKFAAYLAKNLTKEKQRKSALIIALKGNLGAGKTTFVQGFLRGLGVKSKITSPTFVLIKTYNPKPITYNLAYHIDCYRIKNHKEILDLGFKEIISNPQNIVLIEWPERISKILPRKRINIFLEHGKRENERKLSIKH